ncbi:MAG TPA: SDR family oxidoreductase [Polyangia bacterium]|nr:SDR family oxidoreductase [Polyangia bacterium]
MDLGLNSRVAFVTGSSQGIGSAIARLFAKEGARVAISYRKNRDKALALADELEAAGGEAMVVAYDLASRESIHAAAAEIAARWGGVDCLVNNAVEWESGSPRSQPAFEQLPEAEWSSQLQANIGGVVATIQAVLPFMRKRRWGRIVSISSGVAVDGMVGAGIYGAAKSALHGLTRSLFKELGPDGILVNVVMAGFTLTERVRERFPAAQLDAQAAQAPLRRLPTPSEVASTVVFLASTANTIVTGEIVRASGGIS